MKKKAIKISVIMPVYNRAFFIKKALSSICLQTYQDWELIVVDDGSVDETPKVLQAFAQKDKRIRIIRQENQGQSVARNKGMGVAKGDYIYFCDSDDMVALGLFEKFVNIVKNTRRRIDIFHFNGMGFFECPERIANRTCVTGQISDWGNFGKSHFVDWRNNKKPHKCDCALWVQFYRREFLEKNKLSFAEGFTYEDMLFTAEAYLLTKNLYWLEDYMYLYHVHQTSIMHHPNEKVFDIFTIIDRLGKVYKKHHIFSAKNHHLFNFLAERVADFIKQVPYKLKKKFLAEAKKRLDFLYSQIKVKENINRDAYGIYQQIGKSDIKELEKTMSARG